MEHMNLVAHDRLVRRQRVTTTALTTATTVRGIAGTTAAAAPTTAVPSTRAPVAATTTARTTARTTAVTSAATGRGVATYATTTVQTTAAVAPTTARTRSSASVTSGSTTRTSATPSNTAAASSSSSGSTSNTSTIVGVVCAIAGVAALIALFFGVRKYRAKKAARSGGAGFTKHDEDDDVFGNSHADPNNGGGEKFARTQSYGAIGGNSPGLMAGAGAGVGAAAGMAGFGAGRQQQQQQEYQHQQQQHQQFHPQQQQDSRGWDSPSLPSTPSSYPPPSSASSLALLQDQQHRSSRYEDSPYGAGAAGGGALARIEETNGMSLPGMPTPSPFVEVASQGKIHIVKRTFEPTLGDELVIFPGDRVQVLLSFDDGWALGINLDAPVAGTKGVFPFDCLDDPAGAAAAAPSQQQQQQQASAPSPNLTPAPLPTQIPYNSPSVQPSSPVVAPRALSPFSDPSFTTAPRPESPFAARPESPFAPSVSPSFAPQLAPLRSDSPLNFGPAPAINVTQEEEDERPAPLASPRTPGMDLYEQQQQQLPGSLQAGNRASLLVQGNREGDKGKRTSSLIASRDASLFMALGEVLDKDEGKQ